MISIIVIGKNEGWKLTKCLHSLSLMRSYYRHLSFETIYIDSHSIDDSISRASRFGDIKIYRILGTSNAALARNIGAQSSIGDILFFIDGDMEIDLDFLSHVLDSDGHLLFDCATGHLIDHLYSKNSIPIAQVPRTYKQDIPTTQQAVRTNGGIFLIRRKLWLEMNGMRTKYKRSQDMDLILRLSERGILTIRIPHLIARHHTISYNAPFRMWSFLLSGSAVYSAMLLRDHIFNPYLWIKMFRYNYSAFYLAATFLSFFLYPSLKFAFLLTYLLIVFTRSFRIAFFSLPQKSNIIYLFERIAYQIISDIFFILGFSLFYPRNINSPYKRLDC